MRKLAIILLSLMLILVTGGIVSPVTAQAIPTPPPSTQTIVSEVSEAAQTLGVLNVVLLGVVGVLVLVVVFFVVAVWKLGVPLVNTVQRLFEARERQDANEDAREQSRMLTREREVDVLERYEILIGKIETKTEAQASRTTAVEAINAHTDKAVAPAIDSSSEAVTELKKLSEQMKSLVTQKHFDDGMKDMQKQLDIIIDKMERKTDTGQLDAAKVPDAPPTPAPETAPAESGTLSEVDAKE